MIEKTSLEKSQKSIDLRPLASFFLTALAMIAIFAFSQIAPFGGRTIMTSDLGAQYGPYLVGYRQALTGNGSLLYSFKLGMGSNTLGVFAYYLSSPLNLLTLLFPASRIQELIVVLIILKLSLASSMMTWLLDWKFKSKDRMTVIFGMMYPFCAFVMIYMFNIMWLDAILLLPLLIMLTERFMVSRRNWPWLTAVLLVLFVSGYYMAYMVGIFSFLYLLSVMAYRGDFSKEKEKEGLRTVGAFILSAVTAALCSACILIPAGLNTLGNQDYTVQESLTIDPEFSLLEIFDQLVEKQVGNLSSNLPYIFCGLTALLLCILFFIHPKIKKSMKIGVGAGFSFLIFSFHFPFLNRAWHLFDRPNWFNYRYSYLFSFLMIMVAYYVYTRLQELQKKHFYLAEGFVLLICIISQSFGQMRKADNTFFATILISLIVSLLLYGKTLNEWPKSVSNLRQYATVFLVTIIVIDVVLFAPLNYIHQVYSPDLTAAKLTNTIEKMENVSEQVPEENGYRTEIHDPWVALAGPGNLSYYADRHGISIFASMANKKTNHFLKQLGYEANYNYFSLRHDNLILPTDSMLGVRYVTTINDHLDELQSRATADGVYLYENPYALPIAYLVEPNAGDFDGYALEKDEETKDYFDFQEKWISSLSGSDASDLYSTFSATWQVVNGDKTELRNSVKMEITHEIVNELNAETLPVKSENVQVFLRKNEKAPIILRAEFMVEENLPIYFLIPFPYLQNEADIYLNGEYVEYCNDSSYSRIYYLGTHEVGDKIQIEIRGKEDVIACYEPIFAYYHAENFTVHQEKLMATVQSIHVEDGHVALNTTSDTDKLLFTTIPYEEGWEAWVDGQKTELIAYQDAFLSIPLSAGTHNIELKFTPPGWKAGVACSCVGLLLFVALTFIVTRKKETAVQAEIEEKNTTVDSRNTTTNEEEKT